MERAQAFSWDRCAAEHLKVFEAVMQPNDETSVSGTAKRRGDVVVVLGMHRSGTSALTGVLNLLGMRLGNDLMPASPANEKGYWEHQGVVAVDDQILASLGMSWSDAKPLPAGWWSIEALSGLAGQISAVLREEVASGALWGVKDPRMCRLVPLWQSIFDELGLYPAYVSILRSPFEVAASLMARDGFSREKGLFLWLLHVLEAERNTRNSHRAFVTYESLLKDWMAVVGRISKDLELEFPRASEDVCAEVQEFLSPDLRHHVVDEDEPGARYGQLGEWAETVYGALARGSDTDAGVLEKLDSIAARIDSVAGQISDMLQNEALVEEILLEILDDPAVEIAPAVLAARLYRSAQQCVEAGDLEAAVELLTEVVAQDPLHAHAYNDLGALLTMLGQKELAIRCFDRAWKLSPDDPDVVRNLGRFHVSEGNSVRALQIYRDFLAKHPDSAAVEADAAALVQGYGRDSGLAEHAKERGEVMSAPAGQVMPTGSNANGRAASARIKVVVYSFAQAESAVGRLRVQDTLAVFPDDAEVVWACGDDGETFYVDDRPLNDADLVFVQGRFAASDRMQTHVRAIIDSECPVVVDLDELIRDLLQADGEQGATNPRGLNLLDLVDRAAVVTVPTEYLKQIYSGVRSDTAVLPNLINEALWREPERRVGKSVTIGMVVEPLEPLDEDFIGKLFAGLAEHYGSRVSFVVFGAAEGSMRELPRCTYLDREVDYAAFAAQLREAQIDIAIIPLADTEWGRAATNIQWLQWSVLGVPGVYADLPPYRESVEHEVTGFLAGMGVRQWVAALVALIDSPERRTAMGAAARRKALAGFGLSRHGRRVLQVFQKAAKRSDSARHPLSSAWYRKWIERHALTEADANNIAHRIQASSDAYPTMHVVIRLLPEEQDRLADTIDSVAAQLYQNWKLSVVSTMRAVDPVFSEFDQLQWITSANGEVIDEAINQTALAVEADWVLLIQPGDRIAQNLFYVCAEYARANPRWRLLYTDEDRISRLGERFDPQFKPDMNLEMLRAMPYVGGCCLVRRDALRQIGGFGAGNGLQNWDAALNISDAWNEAAIGHVADVLFQHHVDNVQRISRNAATDFGKAVVQAHLARRAVVAAVLDGELPGSLFLDYHHANRPRVSIIIPTKDRLDLIRPCVESLLEKTTYPDYEVLIANNDSQELDTLKFFAEVQRRSDRVKVLDYPLPYNFSAINNFAAKHASGEYLLLLNNDTLIIQDGWLDRMMAQGQRPDVGVVGARLLFPNGKLQHAGVYAGLSSVADHPMMGLPLKKPGYMGRAQLAQELSAVTAACLLIRKSVYRTVQGLDEERFQVLFNDVDLCLKVRDSGYKVIWTPFATVVHYGSSSLKRQQHDSKVEARNRREGLAMVEKWLQVLANDPAYNRNLSLHYLDLRPEIEVDAPWDPQIETRTKIAAIGFGSDGSWRYRVSSPLQTLRDSGVCAATMLPRYGDRIRIPGAAELERIKPDVLLMHNTVHDLHLEGIQSYKRFNKDTLLVFGQDDLMIDLPRYNEFRDKVYPDIRQRLRRAMRACDRLIVTTEPLADAYRGWAEDIQVVPNYLDGMLWSGLESQRRRGDKPRVGWAGAQQHTGDLDLLFDVVNQTADEVQWVFFGLCFEEWLPLGVEVHTPVAFKQYPQTLASLDLDLAVAPLVHNRFNKCKSNLKLLEYGALGIPVVCTDIEPYQGAPVARVQNRTAAWLEAIRARVSDLDSTAAEGDRLRQWVWEHWRLESHLDSWFDALRPGCEVVESVFKPSAS